MTAPTPLWLCLRIPSRNELRAHQAFQAHGVGSFFAHELVEKRQSRHARRVVRYEEPLLIGYSIVAFDGREDFEARLRAICWQNSDIPIVIDVLGPARDDEMEGLQAISGRRREDRIKPRLFTPGEKVRIIDDLFGGREARIIIHKGNKVRVESGGRIISTTVEKLEAA